MTNTWILAVLRFESPGYLILLLLIPLIVAISIKSLSGLGPVRRWVAIAVRCAVVGMMVLALAGASRMRKSDDLTVLFLLDRSASIPRPLQERAFAFIEQSEDGIDKDDRVGVIAFSGSSSVEQIPMSRLALDRISATIDTDQTDISGALRLAMALFPPDTLRRVIILTDGNENVGQALREAEQYRATGVPIDVVPLTYEHSDEVVFEQLRVPATAAAEQTINLQMVMRAQRPTRGRVLVYQNEKLLDFGDGTGFPVELDRGPNRFSVPIEMRVAGAHRFRAVFEPDNPGDDAISTNNEGMGFTIVSGQGKILILTTEEDMSLTAPSAVVLKQALEREGLTVDLETPGQAPLDQVRLLEYSLVILSNLPRNEIGDNAVAALATYVRELGGGLIMIGGDSAFGAGGWMDTPVEEIMPVSFDVKGEKQIPKGALVLVMHACEVPNGNYIGQRCAVSAIKTLSTRDLVGVLSYQWQSSEQGFWDIPLQQVTNKTAIIQRVLKMQMGDMPDLHEVMKPGVDALAKRRDAAVKHMIIVSDFDPQEPSNALIRKMKDNNITCSTIAIGYGGHMIDEPKAKWIAESTGGKFYATAKFDQLPKIFMKEARIVRRSLIQETPFTPQMSSQLSSLVQSLDAVPPLGGIVLTTPKPLAEIPLVRATEDSSNDPVLAYWQVGLGRTVAFTSGMWSRWGSNWAAWPGFSKFWAQMARWASRQHESANLDVNTTVVGGKGKIRVEALDKDAAAINFMTLRGSLVDPDQEAAPIELLQVSPGVYEGEFDAQGRGNYIVNLGYSMGVGADAISGNLRTGVSVAYSPEYEELEPNLAVLSELQTLTNGRTLSAGEAATAYDRGSLPEVETRRPIWEDLIRWTLILFLLDVAIRRIAINPVEVARKLRRRIGEMAGARQKGEQSAAVLTSLKGARERVREEVKPEASETGAPPTRGARYEAPERASKATEDLSRALGGTSEQNAPVVARPTQKKPVQSEGDYTSRLLKAKRRARGDDEPPKD